MTKNDLAFIQYVKQECKRTGITCIFKNTKSITLNKELNTKCSGYFDSENKELVVSMKHADALSLLVHEYCHLTQWEEGIPLWEKAGTSGMKLDEWLEGKRIKNIKTHIAVVRDLELDNEKRSVKMIKKWDLSINIKKYTKRANAYIHFYNYLFHTRRWSKPTNSPYTNKQVIKIMSYQFNMDYSKLSDKIYKTFVAAKI